MGTGLAWLSEALFCQVVVAGSIGACSGTITSSSSSGDGRIRA